MSFCSLLSPLQPVKDPCTALEGFTVEDVDGWTFPTEAVVGLDLYGIDPGTRSIDLVLWDGDAGSVLVVREGKVMSTGLMYGVGDLAPTDPISAMYSAPVATAPRAWTSRSAAGFLIEECAAAQ